MSKKPYPRTLPLMPKGQVYLGKGGSFDIPKGGSFHGYTFSPGDDSNWEKGIWLGKTGCFHFCAPANSKVARLNGLAPAKKAPRKAAKKTKSIMSGFGEDAKTTPALVLEVGKTYLTRAGRTARVICTDMDNEDFPVVMVTRGSEGIEISVELTAEGRVFMGDNDDMDIISLAPDFDWSCLPPWINYIAMVFTGSWHGSDEEIRLKMDEQAWHFTGNTCKIPAKYAPTSPCTDWRQSLRVRPGYNPSESTK